jgi:hypothetical protein
MKHQGSADAGIFYKKFLVLSVVEGKGRSKDPLGRVVIDLAEFAADNNQEQHSFEVAALPAITAVVGPPRMLITIA